MQTFKLPPRFYWDHRSRGLPSGEVEDETDSHVVVTLSEEEREELLSDAEHYVDQAGFMSVDPGLIGSAQATVRKLQTQPDTDP